MICGTRNEELRCSRNEDALGYWCIRGWEITDIVYKQCIVVKMTKGCDWKVL